MTFQSNSYSILIDNKKKTKLRKYLVKKEGKKQTKEWKEDRIVILSK